MAVLGYKGRTRPAWAIYTENLSQKKFQTSGKYFFYIKTSITNGLPMSDRIELDNIPCNQLKSNR